MVTLATRTYQRKFLRAPYRQEILFVDQNFIFKASTINVSEGGLLIDQIPFFPENTEVPMMLSLPQYPYFKDFSLEKMRRFSFDLYPQRIVRAKATVVRKEGLNSAKDIVSASRFGVHFTEISNVSRQVLAEYVDVFASNLIFLQILIDSIHDDEQNLDKVRILSKILQYDPEMKVSGLRHIIDKDYLGLQWL